jgi:5-methylcytosine-specific restriction endonuclease McrA
MAQTESFHVLKHKAKKVRLEAEQQNGLGLRQHAARCARSYGDEIGMVRIELALEPHVGTVIVKRAEAEAARLYRAAKTENRAEPYERHLTDAFSEMLSGSGAGPARRPELVVLVSHDIARRGWREVKEGEVCKIPGVGPVSPQVAKRIAQDAFLSGVFYDGKDLRHFVRWSRNIPIEVAVALELGKPPGFDGVACVDCGNRFRTEFDHVEPRVAHGPTSTANIDPRCWSCHQEKTARDRRAGRLRSPRACEGRSPPVRAH